MKLIPKAILFVRDLFIVGGVRIWLLYAAVLCLIVAPAAYIRTTGYDQLQREFITEAAGRRQDVAVVTAQSLADRLEQIETYTLGLATNPRIREAIVADKWQEAADLVEINRRFQLDPYDDRVILADEKGILQADTPALPGVRGQDFSYRPWYTEVISTGQTHVSYAYQRVAKPPLNIVTVAAPVNGADNTLIGLVVTQVSLDHFAAWVDERLVTSGAKILVVDQRGQLVAMPDANPQAAIMDVTGVPGVREVLVGRSGVQTVGNGASKELVAYAPLSRYGWGVVLQQPFDQALSAQTRVVDDYLKLELIASLWNFLVLLLLLVTIHRLIQYLFAHELRRHGRRGTPSTGAPVKPKKV